MRRFFSFLFVLCVCSASLFAEGFGGIEKTSGGGVIQLPPIEIGGAEDPIPPPPVQLSYAVSGNSRPMASGGFEPFHDAPSFENFSSIASATDEGQKFSSGTCYGVSYMTSIWYAGIVRHLKKMKPTPDGPEVKYIGYRDTSFGSEYDNQAQVCNPDPALQAAECPEETAVSEMPYHSMDGVTYLASMAKTSDPLFFNQCGRDYAKCRLFEISNHNELKMVAQQSMIHHHNQQFSVQDVELKVRNPSELNTQIEEIAKRVTKYGSVFFYWYVYNTKEKWGGDTGLLPEDVEWNQFESGHAMLIYRISKVKVKVGGKQDKEAWKLHLYDPNKTYRDRAKLLKGEGYGTYLLYFPASKTITFSNAMQKLYSENSAGGGGDAANIAKNLQGNFPVIDGKQTIIGFSDFYEGHIAQYNDAADMLTFTTGHVATPKDEILFEAFAKSEDCAGVQKQVEAVRKADSQDGGRRMNELQTWIVSNYQAFQNHLRENDVIKDNEECDPFE